MDKKPTIQTSPSQEFNLPEFEEKVLSSWKAKNIFEKSLRARETKDRKKTFVFYEGPPYANGKPGIHHVLARVVKDIVLRYKSMAGFYVPRRAGWDTHGLPVEIAAEKALGLKSKKDIEHIGIEVFNAKAKENVWLYKAEWENLTERIGYWLDLKNAYVTYAPEYIESIWWTLKRIWERKLLYKGHKVVPWCTRCGTALSSHELAQGYKETVDQSVYLKFKLRPDQKIKNLKTGEQTYILSWTTTPWTLPGNVGLAVGKKIDYIGLEATSSGVGEIKRGDIFLMANNPEIFKKVFGEGVMFGPRGTVVNFFGHGEVSFEKLGLWSGEELAGLEYEPLFDIGPLRNKNSHKIYTADFVTTTDGTGVVHTAVMYGEDDYLLGVKVDLPQHHTVSEEGRFTAEVPAGLAGMPVKPKDAVELKKTEEKIFEYLREKGNFLRVENYSHEYPYCWRCDTPIIYYARDSWFIAMSKMREKLLSGNKKINWIPEYVKEGRFGEWLREVKDWNLSRERYWGAPLPLWECSVCKEVSCIGSLDELSARAGGSKNKYWIMRHGEAESNIEEIIDSGQKSFNLTLKGRTQTERAAKKFALELAKKKKRIDVVIASDILRTKETGDIMARGLGVSEVSLDSRIREINLGSLSGCHDKQYHALFPTYEAKFEGRPGGGGESLRDLRTRVSEFFKETEKKYDGKNILIVSHEYPIWMAFHVAEGWSEAKAIQEKEKRKGDFVGFAEVHPLGYKNIPRNGTGEVDLHRPYADTISIECASCKGEMKRVKEVADVWYDSGAMPFASAHFPFGQMANGEWQMAKKSHKPYAISQLAYPADFISEGMDQTRGWFYTLLAVATASGYGAPYKNVISLGLINDKLGQKMSKSRGNIVDPWEVIKKYGVDAVRWYFYTANPLGEPKNFDENEIAKTYRKFHLIIWNSLKFYETYQVNLKLKTENLKLKKKNVLDEWIMLRLREVITGVTGSLDVYDIREAALAIESFVDDLSRWYIRRSRQRFQKPKDEADHYAASSTLGIVLLELTKILAPFTPFFSEAVYKNVGLEESVHLENWPAVDGKIKNKNSKLLLEQMVEVRRLAALGLAARAVAGIKVRQPLQKLKVKSGKLKVPDELLAILADEVNVKEVVFDPSIKDELELDMVISAELREEGTIRELVRLVQDLRQRARLKPEDNVEIFFEVSEALARVIRSNDKEFMRKVGAINIEYKKAQKFLAKEETNIEGENIKVWLKV